MSSSVNMARRNLFRGMPANAPLPVRPPHTVRESVFLEKCSSCQDCATACPENIITVGAGGFPEIDFNRGECTFCNECAKACNDVCFDLSTPTPWSLKLDLSNNCLAMNQVVCQSCSDACDQGAIRFQPRIAAVATPEIDQDICNGCGACVSPCPTDSLNLRPVSTRQRGVNTYA